jgi:hypothetical protein
MTKQRQPREYFAYEGKEFTIEWYYDAGGYSQALEYAESLDDFHQRKLLELFRLMGDLGQVRERVRSDVRGSTRRGREQALTMSNPKKSKSTYARWMRKPGFKKAFDEGYKELLLSELVLALMAEDTKSVRQLAAELGLSKTVIQNLRSGTQSDMKLSNFLKFTRGYGYHVVLEKGDQRISL